MCVRMVAAPWFFFKLAQVANTTWCIFYIHN